MGVQKGISTVLQTLAALTGMPPHLPEQLCTRWWAFQTSVELRGGDLLSFWWGIRWMDSYHWGPLATAGSVSSLWQMASRRLSAHLSFWHDLSVLPLACGWAVLRLAQEQFHPMLKANFAYVRRWFLRLTKPVY